MCCKEYIIMTVFIQEYWYHECIAVLESICFTAIFVFVCSVIIHTFLTRQVKRSYSDMIQNGALNVVPNSWDWSERLVILYTGYFLSMCVQILQLYTWRKSKWWSNSHCAGLYMWMWFHTRVSIGKNVYFGTPQCDIYSYQMKSSVIVLYYIAPICSVFTATTLLKVTTHILCHTSGALCIMAWIYTHCSPSLVQLWLRILLFT